MICSLRDEEKCVEGTAGISTILSLSDRGVLFSVRETIFEELLLGGGGEFVNTIAITTIIIKKRIKTILIIITGIKDIFLKGINKMQRLFDVKKTQIQMVEDRGYIVPDEEIKLLDGSLQYFISYLALMNSKGEFTARGSLTKIYKNQDGESMLVYYGNLEKGKQISIDEVRKYENMIDHFRGLPEENLVEAILIVDHPMSSSANSHINTSINLKIKNQIFQDSELCYNPTYHVLVPTHIKLTEQEKQEKIKELMVDTNKIPLMLPTDPIARYYGWTTGDMILITRIDMGVSILAPKSINYRIITG